MRATEASGVQAARFAADSSRGLSERITSALKQISPVTFAVAITALLAATLYVVTDGIRTLGDAQARAALLAQFSLVSQEPPAAPGMEVFERGLAAFGLAFFVSGLAVRRRADAPVEATSHEETYTAALTSIREEQRELARRYHEEKLRAEAASRSKTSFLAHLSHDIRTPLNHIIGFAELMRQETYGPLGDARYVDYLDTIRHSGERLLGFFGTILDLAELEGGRRILEERDVGVDDLLTSASRRFAAQAQRARVTLNIGAPCGARLVGDRFSLERMLGNLIDNAIHFTPAGGRVSIAAHAALDGVVLEISDTGIGMAPEQLARASQPFPFGDAALTKDRDGAGLGLAIARTIAELSGGHLAIDSRLGLGTTVAVSLPLPATQQTDISAAA